MTLGAVHARTARRHAAGARTRTLPRHEKGSRFDREGRELGLRNAEGRPYSVCTMCGRRSMVKYIIRGVRTWHCEHGSCGYHDDANGPLN